MLKQTCSWHKCFILFSVRVVHSASLLKVHSQMTKSIPHSCSFLTDRCISHPFLVTAVSLKHWSFLTTTGKKLLTFITFEQLTRVSCSKAIDNTNNLTGVIPAIYFNEQKNTAQDCISRNLCIDLVSENISHIFFYLLTSLYFYKHIWHSDKFFII